MPFFHEASHRKTMCSCCWRAWARRPSTRVKSNVPSVGSISSKLSGVTTVLRFMEASLGQMGFMCSRLEEEELRISPPRMRKG